MSEPRLQPRPLPRCLWGAVVSGHTQGPWRLVDYGRGPVQVHAEGQGGAAIALVYVNAHRKPRGSAEHEANARLIAAAPALLEAARAYYRQYGNCGAPIQQAAADAMLAAIRTAGGAP